MIGSFPGSPILHLLETWSHFTTRVTVMVATSFTAESLHHVKIILICINNHYLCSSILRRLRSKLCKLAFLNEMPCFAVAVRDMVDASRGFHSGKEQRKYIDALLALFLLLCYLIQI